MKPFKVKKKAVANSASTSDRKTIVDKFKDFFDQFNKVKLNSDTLTYFSPLVLVFLLSLFLL